MFRKGKKRHSSSSSQSSEISTKSKSVDSSLGGLSRSSTVASLDTDSTKSSGQSNNNSDTCAEFRIKYVGAIEKLKFSEGKSLEGALDLINYIDVAQQDGKLPFVPLEEEFIMGVSKYGIKVSTSDQYDVLHRHALYLIIRMVCYDDGLGAGRSLLALKTTDASNEEYSLWVYQCHSLVRVQVGLLSLPFVRREGKAAACLRSREAGERPPAVHLTPGIVWAAVRPQVSQLARPAAGGQLSGRHRHSHVPGSQGRGCHKAGASTSHLQSFIHRFRLCINV